MKKIIKFFLLSILAMLLFSFTRDDAGCAILMNKNWKFKTGDDFSLSKKNVDDAQWSSINIQELWEQQGYEKYNEYAWYRIKVFIPSSLKDNSFLKDSLQIILGKIDDCDQFYLNGSFIGENNKIRTSPTKDEEFEKTGFFDSDPRIQMLDLSDKKMIDNWSKAIEFEGEQVMMNQDPLWKQSTPKHIRGNIQVWVKALEDESKAVGVFNLGEKDEKISPKPLSTNK